VTATLDEQGSATGATPSALDFDVIKERVAAIREITKDDVTDIALASFFGLSRETIWRFRSGRMKPSLPTALAMAAKLGVSVYDISAGNPSPRPSNPTTPRPSNPPTPSKPTREQA
jgi:DNA-binding XRE family transcriptional regulator